jgi:hypothetical protein
MNESLDVRRAIREANSVFSRFPVQVCVPMLLFGVVSYASIGRLQPTQHHYLLIVMVGGFFTFWLDCFAQVVIASMCLRAREGTVPGGVQASEALHYRGFATLVWSLILRYIGWTALLLVAVGAAAAAIGLLSVAFHSAVAPADGISAFAGGFHLVFMVMVAIVAVVVFTLVLSRYIFVLPMLAIAGESEPGFFNQCVRRTLQVWKTAAVVMLIGGAPAFVLAGLQFLVWHDLTHPSPPHGVHLVVQLIGILVIDCYAAWFILLKTGLAVQLMSLPLPVSPEPPPQLADVGPPPL